MTLPGIGTTYGAQAANSSVAATSTALGTITFNGPTGIQGSVITCVVTVPNAPTNAVFTATLGTPGGQGVILDTWGGDSTAGRFQILVGQTLVVTGTGLTPSTGYTCTFGTVTDVGDVEVIIPDPNSSALIAQIGAPQVLLPATSFTYGANVTVQVPPTVRTLLLEIACGSGGSVTNLIVQGLSTLIVYYDQAPYLVSPVGALNYLVVVPIASAADSGVTISATGVAGPSILTVRGDTAQYDESLFYNGPTKVAFATTSAVTTTTLVSGPARLLSCSLSLAAPGGTALLENGAGNEFMRLDTGTGQLLSDVMTFPPNTILPAGDSFKVFAASTLLTTGTLVYAYP